MKTISNFIICTAILIVMGKNVYEVNNPLPPAEPEMVFVQGGTFTMGCTGEKECEDNEKPLHSVTISSFYIGKYPVTQKQWQLVMGTTQSQHREKDDTSAKLYGEGDNYPMYYVSWDDTQEFIRRLNKATGKQYRLPTEAEWEYAARGGNKSRHYKYSGSNNIDSVAWYTDNSRRIIHPVGTLLPNELGIYDMSGNVWEWCLDWFGAYSSSPQRDPIGKYTSSIPCRVLRGGSYRGEPFQCSVYRRFDDTPSHDYSSYGFRLVLIP